MSLNLAAGGTINNAGTCVNRACVCVCVLWAPDSLLCLSEFTLPDARVRARRRGKDSVGTGPSPKRSLEQSGRGQDAAAGILGVGGAGVARERRGREGGRERRSAGGRIRTEVEREKNTGAR